MNFNQAYQEMLNGKKIKRPSWGGYWFIEDGKVKIKLKTGEIIENDFNQETITNTLANDWEVLETKEKKTWWNPKFGETYWSIRPWSGAVRTCYNDHKIDGFTVYMGLCFQAEEQADFMVEKLKVIHELEKFAYENNTEEIDWSDVNQAKYHLVGVFGDKGKNYIKICSTFMLKELPFNIYFTSKKIAEEAIETIGEDRIKKYYFGVEDE